MTKYNDEHEYKDPPYKYDFSNANLKRLAEVWLDEYKVALYDTNREIYDSFDPGDLSLALAVKKRLNCKPFTYFLDVIAPDLAEIWPPFELPMFAYGAIYSEGNSSQCFTQVGPKDDDVLELTPCISQNHTSPDKTQHFVLTWHKTIVGKFGWKEYDRIRTCLEMDGALNIYFCHYCFGNQLVKFDLVRKLFLCSQSFKIQFKSFLPADSSVD